MRNYCKTLIAACFLLAGSIGIAQNIEANSVNSQPQKKESANHSPMNTQGQTATSRSDELGTVLPTGMSAVEIVKLLLPQSNPAWATLAGAKKWPYAENTFIAIACVAPDEETMKRTLGLNENRPVCDLTLTQGDQKKENGYKIAIGVIKQQESKLVLASSVLEWSDGQSNPLKAIWEHTKLSGPMGINDKAGDTSTQQDKDKPFAATELQKFDFANYQISHDTIAFGIRSALHESYAGGGADFQLLTLMAVINGELRVVFSEPVYYSKMLAGDWNKDGTRQHTDQKGENKVMISSTMTNGYYNLIVKSKEEKWHTVFQWDKELKKYHAQK